MEMKKDESIICLMTDGSLERLVEKACYNWKVAGDRLEQLAVEDKEELYKEKGLELMAVVGRLEVVADALTQLPEHAQSVLLKGCHERLVAMCDDKRMDAVMAQLLAGGDGKVVSLPEQESVWTRLYGVSEQLQSEPGADKKAYVHQLMTEHLVPHLDYEQLEDLMSPLQHNEEVKEERSSALEAMAAVLDMMKQTARDASQLMSLAIMAARMIAEYVCGRTDRSKMEPMAYCAQFANAIIEVLESDEWEDYWQSHMQQLALKGEEPEQDAEEVEDALKAQHGYLYAKFNESPEAFGAALKQADLDDDAMRHLLFLMAKKEMLLRMAQAKQEYYEQQQAEEQQPAKEPLDQEAARERIMAAAMKLHEQVSEKYYNDYELMWQRFVECPALMGQLTQYSTSKLNDGFNMQVLCNIVGWLQREYHLFGNRTLMELGKSLGGPRQAETLKRYISPKNKLLTVQSISELQEVMSNLKSPI